MIDNVDKSWSVVSTREATRSTYDFLHSFIFSWLMFYPCVFITPRSPREEGRGKIILSPIKVRWKKDEKSFQIHTRYFIVCVVGCFSTESFQNETAYRIRICLPSCTRVIEKPLGVCTIFKNDTLFIYPHHSVSFSLFTRDRIVTNFLFTQDVHCKNTRIEWKEGFRARFDEAAIELLWTSVAFVPQFEINHFRPKFLYKPIKSRSKNIRHLTSRFEIKRNHRNSLTFLLGQWNLFHLYSVFVPPNVHVCLYICTFSRCSLLFCLLVVCIAFHPKCYSISADEGKNLDIRARMYFTRTILVNIYAHRRA